MGGLTGYGGTDRLGGETYKFIESISKLATDRRTDGWTEIVRFRPPLKNKTYFQFSFAKKLVVQVKSCQSLSHFTKKRNKMQCINY